MNTSKSFVLIKHVIEGTYLKLLPTRPVQLYHYWAVRNNA